MISRTAFLAFLAISLSSWTGCSGSNNGGSNGDGGGGGGGGAFTEPTPISVSAGQTSFGVDIAVATPASNPAPNAESIGTGNTATNTGTTISQGSAATVLLFGPGLSGSMQVSITGPTDITISGVHSITSTDNTPGLAFNAAVDSNAALGARTVVLRDVNDDITTFTGGLEVVP